MAGYSQDLRERIVGSWQSGHKPAWIATEYNIGFSTVKRYITRYKRLGHVRATEQKHISKQFNAEQLKLLVTQVSEHDDATVDEHTRLWNHSQAFTVSRSTMGRALQALGWTRKKRPSER
ncbi:MAG: IS630 transposase-related protein [Anaerolineae bacterium]|nr:IS630 transposase-related protein [Anaerolineae bacterium]